MILLRVCWLHELMRIVRMRLRSACQRRKSTKRTEWAPESPSLSSLVGLLSIVTAMPAPIPFFFGICNMLCVQRRMVAEEGLVTDVTELILAIPPFDKEGVRGGALVCGVSSTPSFFRLNRE